MVRKLPVLHTHGRQILSLLAYKAVANKKSLFPISSLKAMSFVCHSAHYISFLLGSRPKETLYTTAQTL